MYTDPTGHDTEFNKSLNISGKFLKDGYIDVNAILGMDSRNVVSRDKNGNMTGIQVYNVRNSESVFINLKDSSYMEFDSSGRKSGGKLSNAFKTSGKNYYIKTSILEGFSNQKIFADSAEGFMKQVYSLPINDYNALKDNGMTVDGIAELSYRYYAGQKNSNTGNYKSILDYNNKYLANVLKRYMALKKINDVSSLKLSERELRKLVDMNGSWLPDVRYSDISVLFSMFIRSTGHKVVYDDDYIIVDGKKVTTKNGKDTRWDGSQGSAKTVNAAIEVKDGVRYINGNKAIINAEKQARHLPDTVQGTRSYLTTDAQKLLDEVGGTGDFVQPYKEVVDVGRNVGKYVDQATGVASDTTRVTIHYSKTGVHIVPASPNK